MRIEPGVGLPAPGEPGLFWLGQAGFWIETGAHRILIDPYLSDSLAQKYAGTKHPHLRMMPPPVPVEALPRPDIVLVTHAHTDHMDPGTLGPLFARFPDLPFVVPAAHEEVARARIGMGAVLVPTDADSVLQPLPGLTLTVFPAAHEVLERDNLGRHMFLGYGIAANGLRLFHSGDCVPYDGLADRLRQFDPQILLLPVNGRDSTRLDDGIPGNFTLDEALTLAGPYPYLIPHHFGLFDFNTIDPAEIDAAAERAGCKPWVWRPESGVSLLIRQTGSKRDGPARPGTQREPS